MSALFLLFFAFLNMWNIFALDVAMNPKGGKREEGRVFTVREKKREGRKGGTAFKHTGSLVVRGQGRGDLVLHHAAARDGRGAVRAQRRLVHAAHVDLHAAAAHAEQRRRPAVGAGDGEEREAEPVGDFDLFLGGCM